MRDTKAILELYKLCFEFNVRSEDEVKRALALPDNVIFTETMNSEVVSVCVLNQNTVILLCTAPSHRNKGAASRLLNKAEEHISQGGHTSVKFCDGATYITPGIPMINRVEDHFIKRGYVHSWGGAECVDMDLNLSEFDYDEHKVGDMIDGIRYRVANFTDLHGLVDCVNDAEPNFTKYYENKALYEANTTEIVFVAECENIVCGALIVSIEASQKGVGEVGCTVTRVSYRGRGIATNLVRLGTRYLKDVGLEKAFLGYTYTDIIPMYQRSGYDVCMKYFMGEKKFT